MSRRSIARRENKRRGVLPSFGDIILPVVSVAAVVLLVIAGRQFFLNGLKTSPEISSTRAYAEAPALIAEREKKVEAVASADVVSTDAEIALKLEEEKKQEEFLAVAVQTLESEKSRPVVNPVNSSPESAKKVSVSAPRNSSPSKPTPQVKPANSNLPMNKQWRVQIGAYTTKSGAEEAAKKIKKAGYKAVVYQNPASKHFKVWVQGGIDKKSAERVVTAMQKLGYKGSFSFPPAK